MCISTSKKLFKFINVSHLLKRLTPDIFCFLGKKKIVPFCFVHRVSMKLLKLNSVGKVFRQELAFKNSERKMTRKKEEKDLEKTQNFPRSTASWLS